MWAATATARRRHRGLTLLATYVVGDVHGCFKTLRRLLERCRFETEKDRLWLVGDLVNRGPRSLEVLKWATDLEQRMGDRFQAVLGNHDLHLIARAEGLRRALPQDTLEPVLKSRRRDELIEWLSARPLLVSEPPYLVVHAGLLPSWSVDRAIKIAGKLSRRLSRDRRRLLTDALPLRVEAIKPSRIQRAQRNLAVFTGLRAVDADGEPVPFSGPPSALPEGCVPWFDAPQQQRRDTTVIFGHWAALGVLIKKRVVALDSGCVWGGKLSALRLEDRQLFQQKVHSS